MCRLLYVKFETEFEIQYHLEKFAEVSKISKEYQGHGWGCAYLENGEWKVYHNISPIWEDSFSRFGRSTLLLVHARSAFEGTEIKVENNMPFSDDKYVFIFNGELRGVKIKEEGRIGAEKIFNYIKRFDKGDMRTALEKGVKVIHKKTDYVRAMNIIISDKNKAYIASFFSEDPDYFTLHQKESGALVVCSQPYPGENNWQKISNKTIKVFD